MKCKVCGSELSEGSLICQVCGSPITTEQPRTSRVKEPVRHVEDVDFNWNTFDFPKPKKPEDIEMTWPQFNVHHKIDADAADEQIAASMASRRPVSIMRNDAQEGFVFTNAAPARPEPQVVPVVQYVPVQTVQPAVKPVPQNTFSQTGPFAPVWTMPAQQPMPAAEPLWYTQPVAAVTPQGIPVQYVPVYAQPAGPYTIAMQRADGQIPGMPTKAEFAAAVPEADDEPVDENWIKSQLEPAEETQKGAPVFTSRIDAVEEPFKAFAFDEPENAAEKEVVPETMPAAPAEEVPAEENVPETIIPEVAVPEETAPEESAQAEPAPEEPSFEPVVFEQKPAEAPAVKAAIVSEIAAEEKEASKGDRFYTFNKKNEEFQALLDAEYARVKAMRLGEVPEAAAPVTAAEPAAPEETKDSKITYTSDISAAMASVSLDLPEQEPENDEDDAPLTVDAIIAAAASNDPDATRIWTAEEVGTPVFKMPESVLSQPEEVQAEELSSFESMLMSGTSSRDETTDETIKINLSKVREAMVRPLAEDVTVPDFVETEAEERAKAEEAARKALEEKRRAEEELRKAAESENEQLSLRKQRLEEMARAREEFFGSSLSPVVKPSGEVGTIASRKDPAVKAAEEAAKAEETKAEPAAKDTVGTESGAPEKAPDETAVSNEKDTRPVLADTEPSEPDKTPKKEKKNKREKKSDARENSVSYDEYTQNDYRRGGSKIIIFILVLIVLALLLEGAKMMAVRFVPDSTVSVFLTDLETDVFTAVSNFFNTVADGFNMLFKK